MPLRLTEYGAQIRDAFPYFLVGLPQKLRRWANLRIWYFVYYLAVFDVDVGAMPNIKKRSRRTANDGHALYCSADYIPKSNERWRLMCRGWGGRLCLC